MLPIRPRNMFIVLLALRALAASGPAAAGPVFQGLGHLPSPVPISRANAVSADGTTVVGLSNSATGPQAFRWTFGSGMIGLGHLSGDNDSEAFDVSGNGSVIVGTSLSFPGSGSEGFRWEGGVMSDLGTAAAGWSSSYPSAVTLDGSTIAGGGGSANGFEAFRWTQTGGFQGLGDLPGGPFSSGASAMSGDGTVIVGKSEIEGVGVEAFRWTAEKGMVGLGFLPGGADLSVARAISSDGAVIVGVSDSAAGEKAFRWTSDLGPTPIGDFTALALSGDGSVIVGEQFPWVGGPGGAIIWDEMNGARNLRDLLQADYGLDLTGWELESASDISADGTVIVGHGINPFGDDEGWIAVIPEPATLVLLTAGLWLIPRHRRYRRHHGR